MDHFLHLTGQCATCSPSELCDVMVELYGALDGQPHRYVHQQISKGRMYSTMGSCALGIKLGILHDTPERRQCEDEASAHKQNPHAGPSRRKKLPDPSTHV